MTSQLEKPTYLILTLIFLYYGARGEASCFWTCVLISATARVPSDLLQSRQNSRHNNRIAFHKRRDSGVAMEISQEMFRAKQRRR